MPQSQLRLIKRWCAYISKAKKKDVGASLRGIYVLYKHVRKTDAYNVVYVGMSASSIRGRLSSHIKNKQGLWTHFSVFEVWDNIRKEEIKELEGLFREIYKKDSTANKLNKQGSFKKLKYVEKIFIP